MEHCSGSVWHHQPLPPLTHSAHNITTLHATPAYSLFNLPLLLPTLRHLFIQLGTSRPRIPSDGGALMTTALERVARVIPSLESLEVSLAPQGSAPLLEDGPVSIYTQARPHRRPHYRHLPPHRHRAIPRSPRAHRLYRRQLLTPPGLSTCPHRTRHQGPRILYPVVPLRDVPAPPA